jgi:hypothetical protein
MAVDMQASHAPTWIAPVAAVGGLLFSAGCAWWQARRDRTAFLETGRFPSRDVSWPEVILFLLAVIGPIAALKTVNDHKPAAAALALSLAALVSQLLLLPRCRGRVG